MYFWGLETYIEPGELVVIYNIMSRSHNWKYN